MRPGLYHAVPSYCSQKARLALFEKGVEFESRPVDIVGELAHLEPWYMRLNPRGVVPTLVNGERVVVNSLHIVRYIDETFEGPPLSDARGWTDRLDAFPMHELSYGRNLVPNLGGLVERKLERVEMRAKEHPELRDVYTAKADAFRHTLAIWNDEALIQGYIERASELLRELAASTSPFASGDRYTLADTLWTVFLARLELLGLNDLWSDLGAVGEYYARMQARPSFAGAALIRCRPSAGTPRN